MATASLTGMPLELLVHLIATYLPTKDLGALRLTNKYLEKALFDTFAKEFFTKKQFMLTTSSLQALVDISKHGALNKHLKHVIIGLESFAASRYHGPFNDAQQQAFRYGAADQATLLSSGRGRDLLEEAFRNLGSLETMGIRDYEAHGRSRDNNRWRSYGVPTIERETSRALRTGNAEFASQVFVLLNQAFANIGQAVFSVETILRIPGNGLTDAAFFAPTPNAKLDLVLRGFQQLLLTLAADSNSYTQGGPDSVFLLSFLHRTTALKHLRLNFQKNDVGSSEGALSKISTTIGMLPHLQRLDLGMASLLPQRLVGVISAFSGTLLHVSLWKIDLLYDYATDWKDAEDRYVPWHRVLRRVSQNTHLNRMTLGCIGQCYSHGHTVQVKFSDDDKISQECSGDMSIWMPQLIDDLRVSEPRPAPDSDDEDMDDDENDEDMDDEDEEEDDEDEYEE